MEAFVGRLAAEGRAGSPLEPVWRHEAQVRGSPALLAVAEGWAMTERHGAPLVDVLDVVSGALRDGARTQAAVEAALAAPRATAALLGVLPLGGLILGELVGVHPLAVLVGTGAGRVVGCAGVACTVAGRLWMRRLVAAFADDR
jgi:tight adherence protein B